MSGKNFSPPCRLGILGGGQLARMLALAAFPLGIDPWVLSENRNDPAAQVTPFWHQGNPNKPSDLKKFLHQVPYATFESEFLDVEAIRANHGKCQVFPALDIMSAIQDRWPQKNLLTKWGLPTSPYRLIEKSADLQSAWNEFGPLVMKSRRYGYDGYGTHVIKNRKHLAKAEKLLANNSHGFIAEKFISFQREIAVIAARNVSGEVTFYPFVETFQQNSRCLWVKGPLPEKPYLAIKKKLKRFLSAIGYVGVIGIEMFENKNGILINELAPRVHNSGHYTMDASLTDQFTAHLCSITGVPAQSAAVRSGFAMVNLLGSSSANPKWSPDGSVRLHWYGKNENRPGRKMGHINCLAATPQLALNKALKTRRLFWL